MSHTVNPYEHRPRANATSESATATLDPSTPASSEQYEPLPEKGTGPWRYYDMVVVQKGSPIPDRCIKTNEPADGLPKKLRLRTDSFAARNLAAAGGGILLGALFRPLGRLISSAGSSYEDPVQKAVVRVSLSSNYRNRRRMLMMIGALGMALCVAYTYVVNREVNGTPDLLGILLFGLIGFIVRHQTQVVTLDHVEGDYAYLHGANRDFLESLPEWTFPASTL